MALQEQDIIETAPGAFAQIELPGDLLVGIGESTQLILRPRVTKGAPRLYLLKGWLKTNTNSRFVLSSPSFEVVAQSAAAVAHTTGPQYDVFIESGDATLMQRDAAQTATRLSGGDFAQLREGSTPTVARRASPQFIAGVPRQFRDNLPARGQQFAQRKVAPKALGPITYDDVAHWLRTEPALRLPLLPLWRSRAAADPAFRAGVKADLAQHPEWEQYVDPESHARRLAADAERRRSREAARQAARQPGAAAPEAATTVGGDGKTQ